MQKTILSPRLAPWVLKILARVIRSNPPKKRKGISVVKQAKTFIEVVDCATGVAGTYCIRRMDGIYASYWNPCGWAGSGYVFTDKKLADAVQALLSREDK